jgi:hypothetical protein
MMPFEKLSKEEVKLLRKGIKPHTKAYKKRVKKNLPVTMPKWRVGEFVYSSNMKANVPILTLNWEPRGMGGWKINVAGFAALEDRFERARPEAETIMYEQKRTHVWHEIGRQPLLRPRV